MISRKAACLVIRFESRMDPNSFITLRSDSNSTMAATGIVLNVLIGMLASVDLLNSCIQEHPIDIKVVSDQD